MSESKRGGRKGYRKRKGLQEDTKVLHQDYTALRRPLFITLF